MVEVETAPEAAPATSVVLSITRLREWHADLSRDYSGFPDKPSAAFLERVAAFQAAAGAAGVEISSIDERLEVQSRINFWQSARINAGERPSTTLLARFDREAAKRAAGDKAPYKGLAAFQRDDAKNFSGRYEIVGELVKKVRTHRLLALTGLSGSGKSSVIRAGLIPQLADRAYDGIDDGDLTASDGWLYPDPILPGTDPLGALEKKYNTTIAVPADLPAALDRLGAPVLLSIDQFEEVFTLSAEGERRNLFIDALLAAATTGVHRHVVVITMRADYMYALEKHPAFCEAFKAGNLGLQSMSAADLRKAIVEPAARLGVGFEDGLIDKLQASVQGEPAGLPLLSFTLLKLWEMRGDGPMQTAHYEALGGNPRIILTRSADKEFEKLLPEDQTLVKEIFTRLVKINDTLDATSNRIKRAALDVLGRADSVDRVLALLVRNNLIRTAPAGAMTAATDIEVGHEALIRNWDMLTKWVKEGLAAETSRKAFAVTAVTWSKRTTDKDRQGDLLSGLALREAAALPDLTETETAFVRASQVQEARRERWRLGIILLLVVMVAGLAYAIVHIIRQNAEEKAVSQLSSLIAQADSLIERGDSLLAKKIMLLGLGDGAEPPAPMRAALAAAHLNRIAPTDLPAVPLPNGGGALGLSVSTDGNRIMSLWGDGRARIWQRRIDNRGWDPNPIVLAVPGRQITAVVLSLNGQEVLSASRDVKSNATFIESWSASDTTGHAMAKVGELPLGLINEKITSIKLSPDGERVVMATETTGDDTKAGRALVLSTAGDLLHEFPGYGAAVNVAIFSPKGDRILVADDNGFIFLYDGKTYADALPPIFIDKDSINTARFTDTGARFAIGAKKGGIIVYSAVDGERLFMLPGHAKGVSSIAFAPDSTMLASASPDGSVRLWEHGIASGRLLRTLPAAKAGQPLQAVTAVAFMPDGDGLAMSTSAGTVRVVDFNGGKLSRASIGQLIPESAASSTFWRTISNDGRILLTDTQTQAKTKDQASVTTLQAWDTETGKKLLTLVGSDWFETAELSPDGARLATVHALAAGRANTVLDIHSTRDKTLVARIAIPPVLTPDELTGAGLEDLPDTVQNLVWSADGKALVMAMGSGRLLAWQGGKTLAALSVADNHPIRTSPDQFPIMDSPRAGGWRFAIAIAGSRDVIIHDGSTGKEIKRITNVGNIETLRFTPDGSGIFIGTDAGTGAIWDTATGRLRTRLAGRHDNAIAFQTFSNPQTAYDGKLRLLTTSIDGAALIWDAESGALLHRLNSPQGIGFGTFSKDSRTMISGAQNRIAYVWDVETGKRLAALPGPLKSGSIAGWFAANGTQALTLSEDTTLRRWDIETPAIDYKSLKAEACADGGRLSADDVQRNNLNSIENEKLKAAIKNGVLPMCQP
jgi:WD40 repeat protein